jgi:hypothetical protein
MNMAKRLLVLATSGVSADSASQMIDRHYGSDVAVHIVAPASGLSRLAWLANAEDDARLAAEARAGEIADTIQTDQVETEVGDTDPVQAIRDALTTFEADEVVVLSCPDDEVTWLEQGTTEQARERFDIPVRHLVVGS